MKWIRKTGLGYQVFKTREKKGGLMIGERRVYRLIKDEGLKVYWENYFQRKDITKQVFSMLKKRFYKENPPQPILTPRRKS